MKMLEHPFPVVHLSFLEYAYVDVLRVRLLINARWITDVIGRFFIVKLR
jgi:hypothetical protein